MESVVVPVNYFAVFGAAILSMVIGYIWYGPLLGKAWIKEIGMTKEKMESAKSSMGKSYGMMFIGSLIMAYVLQHALVFSAAYLKMTGIPAGIMTGFFNWIGFIAPVTLGSVLWEGKSWKLWIINNGYYIVTLLAMSTLLSIWQ